MSVVNIYDRRKMQKRPKQYKFLSSQNFEVPPGYKSCDIFCVGGGGPGGLEKISGGPSQYYYEPAFSGKVGGPGGYCRTVKNISVNPKDNLEIHIGNGGKPIFSIALPNIKKSVPESVSKKYIGCHQLVITRIGKKYYLNDNIITGYHDRPVGIYRDFDITNNISWEYNYSGLGDFGNLIPNLGGGENSFVKNNNKKIAEAPGASSYANNRIFNSIYYDTSTNNTSSGYVANYLWRRYLLESLTSAGSHPPLYFKNYYAFGGNLGGGLQSNWYIQQDSLVDLGPHYLNGHVGETNGGIYIYDGRYYNYFKRGDISSGIADYPNLSWDQIILPTITTTRYGGIRMEDKGYIPSHTDAITPKKIRDVINTYEKLFAQKTTFNYHGKLNDQYGTATTDPAYVIGNQNTLGYWLGQSNTKEFGEENKQLYAGGGGSTPTGSRMVDNNNNGGDGGGGNGYKTDGTPAQDGAQNTGGGGGYGAVGGEGSLYNDDDYGPGFGGSGIVIIRFYPNENRNIDVNWDENTEIK